jgi:glycosyltransferase involved in cell wall biosynthesis
MACAPFGLAISEKMAEEYSRLYHKQFKAFMNCVDDLLLDKPFIEPSLRKEVRFVYVGGTHLNRWKSLLEIGKAIRELRTQQINAQLVIFSWISPGSEAEILKTMEPDIHFAGSLPKDQVAGVLDEADCLVHVESFDEAMRLYTRLSLSTKIPEYMGAGRPILFYGPSEIASCEYIKTSSAGWICSTQDQADLSGVVKQIIVSREMRLDIGRKAKLMAQECHRGSVVRSELRSLLAQASRR